MSRRLQLTAVGRGYESESLCTFYYILGTIYTKHTGSPGLPASRKRHRNQVSATMHQFKCPSGVNNRLPDVISCSRGILVHSTTNNYNHHTNKNFQEMIDTLFRMVQTDHHLDNWKKLPKSISIRLSTSRRH